MNNRSIGKIISIGIRGIVAEVYEDMGNYINTIDGIRFVGEVGSYVSIYDIGRTIISEVIGVDEKPIVGNQQFVKPNSNRQIFLNLLGEISEGKFYFGVSKMPLIFSEINIITEKDLKTMLEVEEEEIVIPDSKGKTRAALLAIGQSVIFPDYKVRINIDKFFGFHFAVFGNTGAGKSNTIAKIIQTIFEKNDYAAKGAKFIIIDSNGEYTQAFSKLSQLNAEILTRTFVCNTDDKEYAKLEIPVWALSADDWAVLLHASEKTQIPILRRAIDIAKIFFDPQNKDNKLKNHILANTVLGIFNSSDTSPSKSDKIKSVLVTFGTDEISLNAPIGEEKLRSFIEIKYGNFQNEEKAIQFLEQFIYNDIEKIDSLRNCVVYDMQQFSEAVTFATLYEGSISSQRIQEYTATLVTRLQSLQDSIQGTILTKTEFVSVDAYIDDLLGKNQVVDLDISNLDDASAEVVTKVLAKLLLDYLRKRNNKADMPINFLIEEAHRFIKNDNSYGAVGYNIFERIAKEGRKYGLLMGISSQRPSELSKTVVSQCSNFVIHRVQNPDDLQYISKMVPYVNQTIIERLTYLQTGNALVFGTAINLPTLTKFEQANPKTDSENARISEKWYIE